MIDMNPMPGQVSDATQPSSAKKLTPKEIGNGILGLLVFAAVCLFFWSRDSNYSGMYLYTGPVIVNNTALNDRLALVYLDLRSDKSFIYTVDTGMGYPLDKKVKGTWKSEGGYAVLSVDGQEILRFKREGDDMIAENGNRYVRTR